VSPTFEAAQRSNLPERSAGVAMFYNQRYRSGRERGRFGNYLQVIRWAAVAGDRPDEGLSSAGQVADSVNLASAGMDFDPVLFMIEARWFSKVRWLIPRSGDILARRAAENQLHDLPLARSQTRNMGGSFFLPRHSQRCHRPGTPGRLRA